MSVRYSIIIPAKNAEDTIARCLGALRNIDYPTDDYEIIVIDDDSSDDTAEIARSFGVRVISANCTSIAQVRNLGVSHAKGEMIAHLDSDMLPGPNWLKKADWHYNNGFKGAIHFPDRAPEDSTRFARLWSGPYRRETVAVNERHYLSTTNLIMPVEIHRQVGGFDETLFAGKKGGSDKEFTYRIRKHGYRLISDPGISMIHLECEENIIQFLKKEYWHQGNILLMAEKNNWPIALLRTPMFAAAHLFCAIAFGALLLTPHKLCAAGALVAWTIPSAALLAKRMNLRKHAVRFPQLWALTFIKWNIAGLALPMQISQYARKLCAKKQ